MNSTVNDKPNRRWIGLLLSICLLVSCAFSERSKQIFNLDTFTIEIRNGFYPGTFLSEVVRISLKQKSLSRLILEQSYNHSITSLFEFKLIRYKNYIILYNASAIFNFFVFDNDGNSIASFPIKNFVVESFKIDDKTGFIRVVGHVIKEQIVKTVTTLDMGKSWSIQ